MTDTNTLEAIRTDRMVLRPLRKADAGLIRHYASDARLARMTTGIPHPYPPGAAEAFVDGVLSGRSSERVWVMDGTPSEASEVIGLISARPARDGSTEIGYWVGTPFQNTGYASEAVLALVDHLDRPLSAQVFQDNPASARIITKAGFRYCGETEAYSVARGGVVPMWVYRLEADDVTGAETEAGA